MAVAISLVSMYLDKILALSDRVVMLYGNQALGTVNVEKNEKQAGPIDGRPKIITNTRLTLRFGLENPDWSRRSPFLIAERHHVCFTSFRNSPSSES